MEVKENSCMGFISMEEHSFFYTLSLFVIYSPRTFNCFSLVVNEFMRKSII